MFWEVYQYLANVEVKVLNTEFYIHGSVHHETNLIIVQQDATYSVYYISVGSSTSFSSNSATRADGGRPG
jgi:hypothetical protein